MIKPACSLPLLTSFCLLGIGSEAYSQTPVSPYSPNQYWVYDHAVATVSPSHFEEYDGNGKLILSQTPTSKPYAFLVTRDSTTIGEVYGSYVLYFRWTGPSNVLPPPLCIDVTAESYSYLYIQNGGTGTQTVYTDDGIGDTPVTTPCGPTLFFIDSRGTHLLTQIPTHNFTTNTIISFGISQIGTEKCVLTPYHSISWFGNPNLPPTQQ